MWTYIYSQRCFLLKLLATFTGAGLDNESIYRWDLKMGQRDLLDRLPVGYTASVTSLDWCCAGGADLQGSGAMAATGQSENIGFGWLVRGGFDRYGTSLLLEQEVIYRHMRL